MITIPLGTTARAFQRGRFWEVFINEGLDCLNGKRLKRIKAKTPRGVRQAVARMYKIAPRRWDFHPSNMVTIDIWIKPAYIPPDMTVSFTEIDLSASWEELLKWEKVIQ